MPFCELENARIFYEDVGFGEPILFLHSHYNRGILAFSCQMQELHGKYRCILPDFRGHGRTTCDSSEWGIPMNVEDMIGLLDALNIEKAHLVGYGGGSVTGFHLAIKYPKRIASLTSIGFSGLPYKVLEPGEWLAEGLIRNGRFDFINQIIVKHYDAHQGDWQGFLEKTYHDDNDHNDLGEENIKQIKAPILLIAGEHDPFSTPKQHKKMKELLPSIEIMVCENADHRPHMVGAHTVAVNNRIKEFLKKHSFAKQIEGILPIGHKHNV